MDERNMKVFYNVQLVGWDSSSMSLESGGLQLALSFETSRPVKRWEADSALMYGNILCLSPNGRFQQAGAIFILHIRYITLPKLRTVDGRYRRYLPTRE